MHISQNVESGKVRAGEGMEKLTVLQTTSVDTTNVPHFLSQDGTF